MTKPPKKPRCQAVINTGRWPWVARCPDETTGSQSKYCVTHYRFENMPSPRIKEQYGKSPRSYGKW